MEWIKKIVSAIIIGVISTIIAAIIMNLVGIIDWDWCKNLLDKIWEFKIIVAIVIAVILIIMFFSYIRFFFKWLLMLYFKFTWKINKNDIMNFVESSKREKLQSEIKSNFDSDLELEYAIDTYFSDVAKKQTFIEDYLREKLWLYENDPDTWAVLYRFQKEQKELLDFIKYLEGFFEALDHWSKEKLNEWTKLSIKKKEAEFLECMKQVDGGKLKEIQEKNARFQSIRPEYVFFRDRQDFVNYR